MEPPPPVSPLWIAGAELGGGAVEPTFTVTDCELEAVVPVHVNVYTCVVFNVPVACVPEVAFVPDQLPLAEQLVAFNTFHVNVDVPPTAMAAGAAVSVMVGPADAAPSCTVADADVVPFAFVQLSV
jgi:hypothetical protein